MRGKQIQVMENQGKKYIKCQCCGEVKELSNENFYVDKHNKNGYHTKCKVCVTNYYKKNRMSRLSYQNSYNEKNGTVHRSEFSYNKIKDSEKNKIEAYKNLCLQIK